jgi:aldose 1-epimerase
MKPKIIMLALLTTGMLACQGSQKEKNTQSQDPSLGLDASAFQQTIDGKKTNLYTLHNENGIEVAITNYGARIVGILTPDRKGHFGDIILGYDSLDGYLHGNNYYFGAIIGRYANRIAGGKFTLDGKQYSIPTDGESYSLHGGTKGFDSHIWDAKQLNDQNLQLTYNSKDGEEGFPGNLKLQVLYTLTPDNALRIEYTAITDKKTVVNFTNHSYFNLGGPGSGKITDEVLMINADHFTPTDSMQLPTGEIRAVKSTPFDFNQPTVIGKRINEDNQQIKYAHGYDDNWILNKPKPGMLTLAAKLYDPDNGREVITYTTEPGIQVYTGNFLDGSTSGIGGTYNHRSALTLETQHYPDAPNHPNFPSTVLKPGEIYHSITAFKFGIHEE